VHSSDERTHRKCMSIFGVLGQEVRFKRTLEAGRLQRIPTTDGGIAEAGPAVGTTGNSYRSQKGSAAEAFEFQCAGCLMYQNSWANRQN
jgi:hypothetical protein